MNKIKRTDDVLKTIFNNQIQFLISSCDSFNDNFEEEAIRLATVVRVLLHDTEYSTSLLNQLNLKNIEFYDSASDYDPQNLLETLGLVAIRIGVGKPPKIIVRLDDKPYKKVSFDEYWNKTVIVDSQKNKFKRKNLILNLTSDFINCIYFIGLTLAITVIRIFHQLSQFLPSQNRLFNQI